MLTDLSYGNHLATCTPPSFVKILRELSGFAAACFSDHDDDRVFLDGILEASFVFGDWEENGWFC